MKTRLRPWVPAGIVGLCWLVSCARRRCVASCKDLAPVDTPRSTNTFGLGVERPDGWTAASEPTSRSRGRDDDALTCNFGEPMTGIEPAYSVRGGDAPPGSRGSRTTEPQLESSSSSDTWDIARTASDPRIPGLLASSAPPSSSDGTASIQNCSSRLRRSERHCNERTCARTSRPGRPAIFLSMAKWKSPLVAR